MDLHRPIGGAIVAVVRQKVKVELPEDMQRDTAIRSGHVVVGLAEHGVKTVQGHVFGQQTMSQSIYFQQPLELLENAYDAQYR